MIVIVSEETKLPGIPESVNVNGKASPIAFISNSPSLPPKHKLSVTVTDWISTSVIFGINTFSVFSHVNWSVIFTKVFPEGKDVAVEVNWPEDNHSKVYPAWPPEGFTVAAPLALLQVSGIISVNVAVISEFCWTTKESTNEKELSSIAVIVYVPLGSWLTVRLFNAVELVTPTDPGSWVIDA